MPIELHPEQVSLQTEYTLMLPFIQNLRRGTAAQNLRGKLSSICMSPGMHDEDCVQQRIWGAEAADARQIVAAAQALAASVAVRRDNSTEYMPSEVHTRLQQNACYCSIACASAVYRQSLKLVAPCISLWLPWSTRVTLG